MENIQQRTKIAVDLDEVLCELMRAFLKWHNHQYKTSYRFDDAVDYHWSNFMGISSERAIREFHNFARTTEYANLPIINGSVQVMAELLKKHELYLITARQTVFEEVTRKWVDKYFPNVFKEIVFTNHYPMDGTPSYSKGEVCHKLGCKILIDDNPYNIQSLLDLGVNVILLNKPWNKNQNFPESVIRADNIKEIPGIIGELVL